MKKAWKIRKCPEKRVREGLKVLYESIAEDEKKKRQKPKARPPHVLYQD